MNSSKAPLFVITASETLLNPWREANAKVMAASLLRSFFSGAVSICRDTEMPLFKQGRPQVAERLVRFANASLYEMTSSLITNDILARGLLDMDLDPQSWVVIADNCGMAMRNIDHLLQADVTGGGRDSRMEFYWTKAPVRPGSDSITCASRGLWAVRANRMMLVLETWSNMLIGSKDAKSDQQLWSELVEQLPLRKRAFEKGEVYAPQIGAVDWEAVNNAAFVTVPDWPEKEQWKFLQALYFGTYFGDETGLMLNILDP